MSDPIATAAADILRTRGVSAVYTPSGGAAIDTRVYVTEALEEFAEFEHLQAPGRVVTVLRRDTGDLDGVGTPANGDTIEITDADSPFEGTTFTVHEEVDRNAYLSRVAVK